MLSRRVLSALFFLPLVLAAVWFGDPWFSILLLLVALLGAAEFYRLATISGHQPFAFWGTAFILLFIVGARFSDPQITDLVVSLAVIGLLVRLIFGGKDAWTAWAWTLGGVFYLGWTLSHFVWLRHLEDGAAWVIFTLLATFAVDTCAYFLGRAFGRHHLSSRLSPGKTWEGAIGGLVGGMAASLLLTFLLQPYGLSWSWAILLGFLIGLFAQLGDLAESALKRHAGVKESGQLIPGHGGMLDRLDSIVFTVVLVYYYVVWAT